MSRRMYPGLPEGAEMPLSTGDRMAIHELISLHGHLADDGRPAELDLLLTEGAVYDVSDFGLGEICGLAALRALWEAAPGDQPLGHHVTNIVVSEAADGTVCSCAKGLSVMADGRCGTVVYDDVVVRTAAGWRISRRKVIARQRP